MRGRRINRSRLLLGSLATAIVVLFAYLRIVESGVMLPPFDRHAVSDSELFATGTCVLHLGDNILLGKLLGPTGGRNGWSTDQVVEPKTHRVFRVHQDEVRLVDCQQAFDSAQAAAHG